VAVHHVLAIEKTNKKTEDQKNNFNDKMQYGHVNSLRRDYSPANGTSFGHGRDGSNFELINPGGVKTAGGGRVGHGGFFEGGSWLTAMPVIVHQQNKS